MKGLALVLVGLFALSALLVPLSPSPVSSPSPVPNAHLTTFGGSTTLVLITIHNTQPIATGTYQQMVVVNSSKYAINSNWSNVEFQYFNGTSIYAWVESNATSAATATTVWLKLYSIPGNGYLTVDMVLYPLTDHLLSVSGPTGEAPQLSASYGALDDGARVFTIYHNFSSPTADPLTGWSGQNYVVSGGLSWSVTGGARFYIQSPVNTFAGTNDTIAEERVHTSVWGMDFGTTSASGGMNDWDCVGGGSMAPQPRLFGGWGVQGCYGSGVNTSHGYFILGYLQDRADAYVNDSIYATVAGGNNGLDHWYMSTGGTGTYSGTISYVRLRTIPNDAMPTVTFPSSPTLTVPINIDNTQSTATGTYQQMVVVNSSRYAAFLNSNDSNVEWRYPNGTAIYAWMESNNSNASTRTTWWLKLYNIPARSNQTVYMDVYGKTDYLLSVSGPSGEAPQLSASYGALDDGARVFPVYDNFSGPALNAKWSIESCLGHLPTVTTGSGLTLAVPSNDTCGSVTSSGWPAPHWPFSVMSLITSASSSTWPAMAICNNTGDFVGYMLTTNEVHKGGAGTGGQQDAGRGTALSFGFPFGLDWVSNGSLYEWVNDTRLSVSTSAGVYQSGTPWISVGESNDAAGQFMTVAWTFGAQDSTSGVMPTVTFLPPPPAPTSFAVTASTASTITLEWTNPVGVLNDSLYYGTSCSALGTHLSLGVVTSTTVTGLTTRVTYCFELAAWNQSTSSGAPAFTNGTANLLPVTGLTLVSQGVTWGALKWTNPAGPVTNDTIFLGWPCGEWSRHISTVGAVTSYNITGLNPNDAFCAGVEAWNGSLDSVPLSNYVTFSTAGALGGGGGGTTRAPHFPNGSLNLTNPVTGTGFVPLWVVGGLGLVLAVVGGDLAVGARKKRPYRAFGAALLAIFGILLLFLAALGAGL